MGTDGRTDNMCKNNDHYCGSAEWINDDTCFACFVLTMFEKLYFNPLSLFKFCDTSEYALQFDCRKKELVCKERRVHSS